MNDHEYGSKEAPVSLSGNLDVFPLEEVLRLLARSRQTGRLRVDGPGAGSVYLDEGGICYAAEDPDDAFRRLLVGAGLVTDEGLNQLDLSKGTLSEVAVPDASTSSLDEIVREQCVESVYRIRKPRHGPFTFSTDVTPRYATGQRYDIEVIISEADRRASEWAEVEEVVPDLSTPWQMVEEISEDSVTISDVAWRYLAALEGGASVETVADRLGLTSFQAARRMAELARAHLVEAVAVTAAVSPPSPPVFESSPRPAPADTADTAPAHEPWPGDEVETDDAPEPAEPVAEPMPEPAADEPLDEPAAEESAPDRSWWEEEAAGFQSPAFGEETPVGDDTYAVEESHGEPGDDADSFLEGVFGEQQQADGEDTGERLDGEDDDGDDHEGGFGLLRRRGLGAAFRELADG